MKKFRMMAALVLAMLLLFSVSVGAFADAGTATGTPSQQSTTENTTGQTGNTAAPTNRWTSILMTVVPILILVAFFYFGIYRPQKKQEKEKRALMESLAVGSEIVTIGGIMGKIVSIKDDSVIIESGSDKNKLQISKGAISTVSKPE